MMLDDEDDDFVGVGLVSGVDICWWRRLSPQEAFFAFDCGYGIGG